MALTKTELDVEWRSLPKNWFSIYQWKRTTGASYTEWIAERIATSFPQIELVAEGLRTRSFRAADHRGQIRLRTGINQLTEKRIVRAMFNSSPLPLMGDVIDYEIPLKDIKKAKHGNIDLLCVLPQTALCVEAKKPKSNESILKAVLEAFVYTSLVATKKQSFLTSFNLDQNLLLTPAVLTFASTQSGRQLKMINKYPQLLGLIRVLNSQLALGGIAPLRFFVIENPVVEFATCLTTTQETNGDVKAVFSDGFTLSIVEQSIR
jgi:hypothetical protein